MKPQRKEDDAGSALVRVTHERSTDADHDLVLTVAVAPMQKDEVPGAIEVPLATTIAELGDALRWQRLLVVFTGDALIPSAANRRVGELLAEARALSVTVRRGYGDEVVHTGERPKVELATVDSGVDVLWPPLAIDNDATTLHYSGPDQLQASEPEPVAAPAPDPAGDELDFSDPLFDDIDIDAGPPEATATPIPAPVEPAPVEAAPDIVATPRRAVSVLARKSDAEPPMVLLAIEWRADAASIAAIERELEDLRDEVTDHRTLVVFHHHRRQFGGPERHPLVIAVRRALEPRVAALLVFREARGLGGVAHFQVVASRLDDLVVGARMKDPRRRR